MKKINQAQLLKAAREGKVGIFLEFIEQVKNISGNDSSVHDGYIQLKDIDEDPFHITSENGSSLLILAVKGNHMDVVHVLIQNAPTLINLQDNYGDTPLHWAVSKNHVNCVNALLEIDAILDIPNDRGETALHKAAYYGYVGSVKALIKKNPNLVNLQDIHGYTPLYSAITWRHVNCVSALLEIDAILDIPSKTGGTALKTAIYYGYVEFVEALTKKSLPDKRSKALQDKIEKLKFAIQNEREKTREGFETMFDKIEQLEKSLKEQYQINIQLNTRISQLESGSILKDAQKEAVLEKNKGSSQSLDFFKK